MLPTVIGKAFISTSRHDLVRPFFLEFEYGGSRVKGERPIPVVNRPAMMVSMIVTTNVVYAVKDCVRKVVEEIAFAE